MYCLGIVNRSVHADARRQKIGFSLVYDWRASDQPENWLNLARESGACVLSDGWLEDIARAGDPALLWATCVFLTLEGTDWHVEDTEANHFTLDPYAASVETWKRLLNNENNFNSGRSLPGRTVAAQYQEDRKLDTDEPCAATPDNSPEQVEQIAEPAEDAAQTPLADEREDTIPALSDRKYEILQAMAELGATSADERQTTDKIAVKAEGKAANTSNYKVPLAELKKDSYVESKKSRGGGYWLSVKGKRVAEMRQKRGADSQPIPD